MIGLDTNVVVRYLMHDHPAQTAAAVKLIDSLDSETPGFLSLVVIVELVWVLEVSYHFGRREIADVLDTLQRSRELVVEETDLVWQALRKFRMGSADFSDCLIERCGNKAGCENTLTFDIQASKGTGMTLLK